MNAEFSEPAEPGDDGGFPDWDSWEASFADGDGVAPDYDSGTPDINDDAFASSEGDDDGAESPVVTAEDLEGFRRATVYLHEISSRAGGAMFTAFVKGELLSEGPLDPDWVEVGDSLARFDVPDTERARESFDQQLSVVPYQAALDAVGVRLGDNPFNPPPRNYRFYKVYGSITGDAGRR